MKGKKNYGFVIERFSERGGCERVTAAVMNGLASRGYSIKMAEIFKTFKTPFPLNSNIKQDTLLREGCHIQFPGGWQQNIIEYFRLTWSLVRYIKRERIDILVLSSTAHALHGIPAARICGIPVIAWEHFNCRSITDFWPLHRGRYVAARWADAVVVLTEQDKLFWERDFPVKCPVNAIPNMVQEYSDSPYEGREKIVFAAGRLQHQKGFDTLLEVWEQVQKSPEAQDWSLLIRGDGDSYEQLMAFISEKKLANVEILPAVSNIESEFKRASIYACSSRFEGFPVVLAEATSAKLPVVSFECLTGPAEIVVDGETGLLINPGDVQGMANALVDLMKDTDKRTRMAEKSRERAQNFYSNTIIKKWEKLLNDVAEK